MRLATSIAVAALAGIALTASATGGTGGRLRLHVTFRVAWKQVDCPAGTPATTSCYLNVGAAIAPGLGKARERYVLLVEHTDTNCADWRFTATFVVPGRGTIRASAVRPGCFSPFSQEGVSRFRVTSGTGAYRGATGGGKIASTGTETAPGRGTGADTWTGTLVVPGRQLAAAASDTLEVAAAFSVSPDRLATTCPAGTPAAAECFAFSSTAPVPGLGIVTETYTAVDDQSDTSCRHTSWSPAVLSVAGKGELDVRLAPATACDGKGLFIGAAVFAITGGTGPYAGASGGGSENAGNFLTDVWQGTVTVAGYEFDRTAPAISGARQKTVRVPAGVKRARVRFKVTAADAVDGPVSVACQPRSGTLFKVGRTRVTCAATDSSANTATASFAVVVRGR